MLYITFVKTLIYNKIVIRTFDVIQKKQYDFLYQ